jgi:hypothetical protein
MEFFKSGNPRRGPYFSVIGTPPDFYVYVQDTGIFKGNASNWIKGCSDDWHKLSHLYSKDRAGFDAKVRELFKKHGPMQY